MIDIRKLKELVRLMVENDLSELDLKDQEETVAIKRGPTGTTVNHQPVIYQGAGPASGHAPVRHAPAHDHAEAPEPGSAHAPAAAPVAYHAPRPIAVGASDETDHESSNGAPAAAADTSGLVAIESPMVGTFYSAPNPDTPAFVSVGASVSPESTVCLIEAMKVFNDIKSELTGTIERILVNNGDAVEFGQKLFLVRPA